jgi:hypothetical protein
VTGISLGVNIRYDIIKINQVLNARRGMVIKGTHSSPVTPALPCLASKLEIVLQPKAAVQFMSSTKAVVAHLQDSTALHAGCVHGESRSHALRITPYCTKLAEHVTREDRPNRWFLHVRSSHPRGAREMAATPSWRFLFGHGTTSGTKTAPDRVLNANLSLMLL